MKNLTQCVIRTAFAVTLAAVVPAAQAADVVTRWNLQVIASGGPQIQRTLAMVHIAMFDAVNAFNDRYTPYLKLPEPLWGVSEEAAAAAAAHGVLLRLFPAQEATLAAVLAASLAEVPNGLDEDEGVAYGRLVAEQMFTSRLRDNILAAGPLFTSGSEAGAYQLTTPGPPQPVNTNAQNWMPFGIQSVSQFRPKGPRALTSTQYTRDFAETYRLGGSISSVRTLDQEQIARWHTEQAPFQFNRLARDETAVDGRDLIEHARLFALLNMALADATASAFDAKYAFLFWRPVTAIQNAYTDGNDDTRADFMWTPFLPTPPHPEYPAAHSVVQGAAARVMTSYFGKRHAFTATAPAVPGATRRYANFDAFAIEGSFARILGGMHFRTSLEDGAKQGRQIGNWIVENQLVLMGGAPRKGGGK